MQGKGVIFQLQNRVFCVDYEQTPAANIELIQPCQIAQIYMRWEKWLRIKIEWSWFWVEKVTQRGERKKFHNRKDLALSVLRGRTIVTRDSVSK